MHSKRYKKASSRIAKRNKVRSFLGLFLKIGLPVAFLVGLVFLLRADFMQVKNFEISGAETVLQENIKNIASGFASGTFFFAIPKSNILLLNKSKLASVLLSDFGRLEKVEVSKNFFNGKIDLKITERKADFLWCSLQDECFAMTKDGFIFESYSALAPLDKIIFRGNLTSNPLMKNFDTPERIQNYLKLVDVLKTANFEVSSINIESSDRAVAKTKINNTVSDIIFNPAQVDLSLTAQNVILLINEIKRKTPSAEFNYIDARFDNKMFYKLL
jgi:cell division septal protein FtsQ